MAVENENVAEFLRSKSESHIYYNRNGDIVDSEAKAYAYTHNVESASNNYVRFYRGQFLDPNGIDDRKRPMASFKKTNENTFDSYLSYLKTKNSIYLTRANRSHIDVY